MFEDDIKPVVESVKSLLKETLHMWPFKDSTVATAESITAGLLSYSLTSIEGSSSFFKQGWVLYQDHAKYSTFAMPEEIEIYSPFCAKYLARNARERSGADWGIGVTGEVDKTSWIAISSTEQSALLELPIASKSKDTKYYSAFYNSPQCAYMDRNHVRQWLAFRALKLFEEILIESKK